MIIDWKKNTWKNIILYLRVMNITHILLKQ